MSDTVKVEDRFGTEFEVPTGIDGKMPVSPNNPAPKAVASEKRDEAVDARKAEVKAAEEQAKAAGQNKKAATTNKEDNTPENRNAATNPNSDESQQQSAAKTAKK